jgi:predicted nucleic acid-binding protein
MTRIIALGGGGFSDDPLDEHGRGLDQVVLDATNTASPLPSVSGLLAATALVHGMTLVTRNTRDVATTGVSLLGPMN